MRAKNLWITLCLVNLCIVTLLGFSLRTKFLFEIPWLDYKNFLSAHSHFAFGGWVTLSLMILLVNYLLPAAAKSKNAYQYIFWITEISALGMAFSFPFTGYAFVSLTSSSLFILIGFVFCWLFLKDLIATRVAKPVRFMAIAAIASLIISSLGPLVISIMMTTKAGNPILFNNALYTFMHFQYNGFFTCSVFALLFNRALAKNPDPAFEKKAMKFSIFLGASIIPALFMTLLWRHEYPVVFWLSVSGCILLSLSLILFLTFAFKKNIYVSHVYKAGRTLAALALVSFSIKMLLQILIMQPDLKNMVFGYRPIIIGFFHLVFLAMVTFVILSSFIEEGVFEKNRFTTIAITIFAGAVFFNELTLLSQGLGLIFHQSSPVYPWLLWIAAMLLLTGAILILSAKLTSSRTMEAGSQKLER